MVVENLTLNRSRVGDNDPEKRDIPLIKPGEQIWRFSEEMGVKYGISPQEAYNILELKIVQMVKLHEDKGARISVTCGETNVEVNFFKDRKNIKTPSAP